MKHIVTLLMLLLLASPGVFASPTFSNLGTGAVETVEDYQRDGKWLVVMIWASDCEICKREVGAYQDFHQRRSDTDARVLGVTLDGEANRQDAIEFVDRYRIGFANLIAEPEAVAGYFEILTGSPWIGTPTFLVFAPNGELMAKQVGAVEVDIVENFIAANSMSSN